MFNCKLILFISSFTLSCAISSNAVVIIIHGSFSSSSTWHSAQGGFFTNLEKTAKTLNQSAFTFNWSGSPNSGEINKAGQMLAKLIASFPKDEPIILVGHSHGGNVINVASQKLLDQQAEMIDNASNITEQAQVKESNKDTPTTKLDLTLTSRKVTTPTQNLRTYKIDCVYQLGTPIDMKKYAPQMKVIKYLFNFYSRGDDVQTVAGMYKKQYSNHERITNIELKIRDSKNGRNYNPSHHNIHHPIIGSWILLIPFELQKEKAGGFQNFEHSKNCIIVFKEKDVPTYAVKN